MRVRWFALISYLLLELITANTFAKNTQKQHHIRDPKTGWSGWATLGGSDFLSESDPAACALSNSGVFIAARGVDNQVHTRYWDGTSWTGWSLNGGATDASPALGRLDVFARGTDGALWHKWSYMDSWSEWESLGGILTSGPGATSTGPAHMMVFVKGTDNAIWYRIYSPQF